MHPSGSVVHDIEEVDTVVGRPDRGISMQSGARSPGGRPGVRIVIS